MRSSISLTAIQKRMAEGVSIGRVDEPTVRRLWWAALDTLQDHFLMSMDLSKGLWLASPLPALYDPRLLHRLKGWVWAPEELHRLHSPQVGLLPASNLRSAAENVYSNTGNYQRIPLYEEDGHDPFLIILTPDLQVALALQGEPDKRNLLIRSDPETINDLLDIIDLRLDNEDSQAALELRNALGDLYELRSNDFVEKIFWPVLSEKLANIAPSLTFQPLSEDSSSSRSTSDSNGEITLLEALTHEVRTPLATIRTLIRSLLKRDDLNELVVSRLKEIDVECTEQIDRFGLIFNAVELQRKEPKASRLASTDLGRMLQMLHPAWKEQLERRGINLHLDIAPDLPKVLSDPERLELMLGGLIDRNTRGLQPGGSLFLELQPAGQRLKLQILSKSCNSLEKEASPKNQNAALGAVLSWNPTTGSLQLSQAATQQLMASLGGRVTNRRDSALTVFFPISEAK